jgi:MFS family permease
MGLELDGNLNALPQSGPSRGAGNGNDIGYSMRQAIGTGTFWLIVTATFFVVFASSGFGLHVIPFFTDTGMSASKAARIWAAVQGVSIGARFFFGYMSERYQKRYFAAAANVSRVVCIAALLLFALNMAPLIVAAGLLILIYGSGMGCNAVTNPLLIGESFGVKNFAKIMGALGIPYTLGMSLGMYAGGRLFDIHKDYVLSFGVFAAAFLLAGVAIFFAKPCLLLEQGQSKDLLTDRSFTADEELS